MPAALLVLVPLVALVVCDGRVGCLRAGDVGVGRLVVLVVCGLRFPILFADLLKVAGVLYYISSFSTNTQLQNEHATSQTPKPTQHDAMKK